MKKILILRLNPLKEILYALPFLNNLKKKEPDSYISWLVSSNYRDIVEEHASLNEIIVFERSLFKGNIFLLTKEILAFLKSIRNDRFDILVDLQGGFKGFFFSLFIKADKISRCSVFNEFFQLQNNSIDFNLEIAGQDQEYIEKIFMQNCIKKDDKLIIFAPAVRRKGSPGFSVDKFKELINRVTKQKLKAVLLGNKGDNKLLNKLKNMLDEDLPIFSDNISLKQKAYLLKKATFLLGNDNEWIDLSLIMNTNTILIAQKDKYPERKHFKEKFTCLPPSKTPEINL